MTTIDRANLGLAAKLLRKAESTDSEEEAVSLALKGYSLVAGWLNAMEGARRDATGRRRERRLLRDRRGLRRALGLADKAIATSGALGGIDAGIGAYGRSGDDASGRSIDLRV